MGQGAAFSPQILTGRRRDYGVDTCRDLVLPPEGHDSVTGTTTMQGGTRMYVVYDSSQVLMTHIVHLELSVPCDAACATYHKPAAK